MARRTGALLGAIALLAASCGDAPSAGKPAEVVVAIRIEPPAATLATGATRSFAATTEAGGRVDVRWSVSEPAGGRIDAAGRYTAPDVAGTFTVVAISTSDPATRATARVTVEADEPVPVVVSVTPARGRVSVEGSLQFEGDVTGTADTRLEWRVIEEDGGTVDGTGRYAAPGRPGSFTVRATSVADPAAFADATVEVVEGVAVTVLPETIALRFGQIQRFTALVTGAEDETVTWSVEEVEGGGIAPDGTYTAPATAGTFHVVATSRADPARAGTAEARVTAPPEVRVEPATVTLDRGAWVTFAAVVLGSDDLRVAWSVDEAGGGHVGGDGTYTAPDTAGTFHVRATSVAEPAASGVAEVTVRDPPLPDGPFPRDRADTWNPGIPGGIPRDRDPFAVLSALPADGTGDCAPAIQQAIEDAGDAHEATGRIQEVVLPAGTFRLASTLVLGRSGVVLRGQGPGATRLRYDGTDDALRLGRSAFGSYTPAHGPWFLARDGVRGSREIALSHGDAAGVEVGDILCIDEEDDPSFVRLGDAVYQKRQPEADTHGPALRGPELWRSVTSLIRVTGKTVGPASTTLSLADPLHMSFRTSRWAQVFQVATAPTAARPEFEGVHRVGVEDLYVTGGPINTNNVAFCWLAGLEVDGNPGTPNVGAYLEPGGISGTSVNLFHAYRCEVRRSYIHHSRDIVQGGGAYLLSLSSYTSETLIEDNVVVFGNKPVVGNMMGGGNVIAYNYVDNARTNHAAWQEGAIDLNHQAFTHSALVEGNWATNLTSDTTHGNAGWHVFYRNLATGQNSAPLYGPYPYASAPDGAYRRAAGTDGFHREATYVGNVLLHGDGAGSYQIDPTNGPALGAAAVWRIGWGVDGDGQAADDGTALRLLYRHGNWDPVTGDVAWDPANPVRELPASLYRQAKPAFFGDQAWPWVDPAGATAADRVKILPAKARYDAIAGP